MTSRRDPERAAAEVECRKRKQKEESRNPAFCIRFLIPLSVIVSALDPRRPECRNPDLCFPISVFCFRFWIGPSHAPPARLPESPRRKQKTENRKQKSGFLFSDFRFLFSFLHWTLEGPNAEIRIYVFRFPFSVFASELDLPMRPQLACQSPPGENRKQKTENRNPDFCFPISVFRFRFCIGP